MFMTMLMAIMLSAVPKQQQPPILIQSEAQQDAEHVPWYGQNVKSVPHTSQRYSSCRHHLQPHSPTYKQLDTWHYEQQYGKVQRQLRMCLWVVGSPRFPPTWFLPLCSELLQLPSLHPFLTTTHPYPHFINNTNDCTSADVVISIPANGELISTHVLMRYNAIYQQNQVKSTYFHTIWISLNNTLDRNISGKHQMVIIFGQFVVNFVTVNRVDKICNNKLKWLFDCAITHEVEVIEQVDMYIYPEVQNLACLKRQMLGKFPKWIEPHRILPSTRKLQESMEKMTYVPRAISSNPFTQQLSFGHRAYQLSLLAHHPQQPIPHLSPTINPSALSLSTNPNHPPLLHPLHQHHRHPKLHQLPICLHPQQQYFLPITPTVHSVQLPRAIGKTDNSCA